MIFLIYYVYSDMAILCFISIIFLYYLMDSGKESVIGIWQEVNNLKKKLKI